MTEKAKDAVDWVESHPLAVTALGTVFGILASAIIASHIVRRSLS